MVISEISSVISRMVERRGADLVWDLPSCNSTPSNRSFFLVVFTARVDAFGFDLFLTGSSSTFASFEPFFPRPVPTDEIAGRLLLSLDGLLVNGARFGRVGDSENAVETEVAFSWSRLFRFGVSNLSSV